MKREDAIEKILTYLTFTEEWAFGPDQIPWEDKTVPEAQLKYLAVPLHHFNGAHLDYEFVDGAKLGAQGLCLNWNAPENEELMTMNIGEWSYAMLHNADASQSPVEANATCLYHIARYRKMKLAEVRGIFKLKTGDLVEWSQAWIYNNGVYRTNRVICERWGRQWHEIGQPRPIEPVPHSQETTDAIFAAKSMAFTRYYDWQVELGFQMPGRTQMPTVAIATSAQGAREAYRLRDVAPGKSRRDALKHWVATHMRHGTKYDPEAETKIWAYLRGVEEFTHNGLKCVLHPSAYDLKKAAEYQRLREQEKQLARRKVS
jgi:hypothetical protein